MTLKHFLLLTKILCAFALMSEAHVEAAEVDGPKHSFVCADFAKGEVCVVGADGAIKQTFKAQNPNDVWALPDGGIFFAWRRGVKLYDKDGELAFEWTSCDRGHSAKRTRLEMAASLPEYFGQHSDPQ